MSELELVVGDESASTPSSRVHPVAKVVDVHVENPETQTTAEDGSDFLTRGLARYALWSFNRPLTVIAAVFLYLITLTVIVIAGQFFVINDSGAHDWKVITSPTTERVDALNAAILDTSESNSFPLFVNQEWWAFSFMFKASNGNVFTPANLKAVKDAEAVISNLSSYTEYCVQLYSESSERLGCVPPKSVSAAFYENKTTEYLTQAEINTTLALLWEDLAAYSYFFDKGFNYTEGSLSSQYTRSLYYFGAPLHGYDAISHDEEKQEDDVEQYQVDNLLDPLINMYDLPLKWALGTKLTSRALQSTDDGEVEVLWVSGPLYYYEQTSVVATDFLWAFFCIVAVWVYMSAHTGSLMLASTGMFEIMITFPVTYFYYRVIFQVTYFSTLHILAIFVMLGIGADDTFVFVDAFKQAGLELKSGQFAGDKERERITRCSIRASRAIFATSLTTSGAFLATAISKLMPISSFGIFASLLISNLFLINCLLLPPVLVLWARWFEGQHFCDYWTCCVRGKKHTSESSIDLEVADKHDGEVRLRPIERFYHGPFTQHVLKGPARYGILVLFTAVAIVGIIYSAQLAPPEEEEQWLPDDHMYTKITNWGDTEFILSTEDPAVLVSVVWGLEGMDISGINFWNPNDRGKLKYDTSFNLARADAQQNLLDTCNSLREYPCDEDGCNNGLLVRHGQVICFLEGFNDWLVENYGSAASLPIDDQDLFLSRLLNFSSISYYRQRFPDQMGFVVEDPCESNMCVQDSETGTSYALKFVKIDCNSSFIPPEPAKVALPVMGVFQDFIDDRNSKSVDSMSGAFHSSEEWTYIITQVAIAENAVQGMGLCFALSFIVILVTTGNAIMAVFSVLTIGGIVSTVLGIGCQAIQGWGLGVAESVAAVILIGFSVDYCVHVANAYMESSFKTRLERTQDAMTTMGVSIIAGALTTLMSGAFLFGAVMTFFNKFGFIICFTIFSSFSWSMFFFPVVCALCGPEDNIGDLAPWIAKLHAYAKARFTKKDTSDETAETKE